MKITSLNLNNAFSYYGNVFFNFDTPEDIQIVIGENGFGKTSFINSIKIALHGISKDVLKLGDTTLTKHEFIMGSDRFSGIVNRVAKKEGINSASIELSCKDKEGVDYKIVRTFKVTATSYSDTLKILNGNDEVVYVDDEAQDFININFINRVLAKFFLFDGEKVQHNLYCSN